MNINVYKIVASLDPATGGPARSVPSLGRALQRAGVDVQLFVSNKEGDAGEVSKNLATGLSVKPIRELGSSLQGAVAVQKGNLLIHNHGIWLPINHTPSAIARRYRIPLVISPRGMLEPWARSYKSWKKTIAWHLYQRRDLKAASLLHATSIQEAKNLQSLGFSVPIAVIPNGVDIPSLSEPAVKDNKIKKMKTALFLSRVHPKKGLVNLVQAWAEVRPAGWRVVIAGPDEGGHQAEVEQEIMRQGLTDTFNFIGSVEDKDKWELYRSSDLFILPTHSENFGIVVAEALASGVPVITTKGTPWAELEEHKCGWWVDIGVEPLAKALKESTNLPVEERRAMGERGRHLVEQNYSWDRIGKEMVSVYEWVLGGGDVPDCVVRG